jgi:hypothetical protein
VPRLLVVIRVCREKGCADCLSIIMVWVCPMWTNNERQGNVIADRAQSESVVGYEFGSIMKNADLSRISFLYKRDCCT